MLTSRYEPQRNLSGGDQGQRGGNIYKPLRSAEAVSGQQNDVAKPIGALASVRRPSTDDFPSYQLLRNSRDRFVESNGRGEMSLALQCVFQYPSRGIFHDHGGSLLFSAQ